MYATQLIGKKAIRTKPCEWDRNPSPFDMGMGIGTEIKTKSHDYSYSDEPLFILAATENHIIYKHPDGSFNAKHLSDKTHILNCRWCDDNWADYDELMKLAEPAIQELVNESMKAAGNEDAR